MEDITWGGSVRPLVTESAVAPFANPFKGGQNEALMILEDHQLVHLERSAAGWVMTPVNRSQNTAVDEVVVAIAPNGVVWALFVTRDLKLVTAYLTNEGWKVDPTVLNNWTKIRVVYTSPAPTRTPVVYGHHSSNQEALKFVILGHDNKWQSRWAQMPAGFSLQNAVVSLYPDDVNDGLPTRFRMTCLQRIRRGPVDDGPYFEVFRGSVVEPSEPWSVKEFGRMLNYEVADAVVSPLQRVVFCTLYVEKEKARFGMMTSRGEGQTFKSYFLPLPGVPYFGAQWVVFFDANQLAHVYGVGDSLCVLHQTGWELGTVDGNKFLLPTWTKGTREDTKEAVYVAVPFAKDVFRHYLDSYPDSSPTLLAIHPNYELTLYTQDLSTGRWTSEPVRPTSNARPLAAPSYRTQATLVDANGVPVPNYAIQLTAKSYARVNVGGTVHFLTPGVAVEIKTDRLGRAIFSTLADGLTTPSLVLNAPALVDGVVIKPDAPVQNYLAGTGTLPLRPGLTGEVLRDAGVVPSWTGKPEPVQVVESIKTYFLAAGPKPVRSDNAGFIIQTFDPSRPAYLAFDSRADLETELAQHRLHELYGGVLDDLKQSLEDLWHGIKSGAAKIVKVAFAAAEGVVKFSLWVGGKVVELYNIIIRSFRDAADVTMALFNQLGASIQSVVAWLQSLFNFKDIWDTKTALDEDGIRRFTGFMRTEVLGHFPPSSIKALIEERRAKVFEALDSFEKEFSGRTLQDLPGWTPGLAMQLFAPENVLFSSPHGSVTRTDVDGPQSNWFFDALLPYDASIPLGQMQPGLEPIWDKFRSVFEKQDYSFDVEFKEKFLKLLDINNPSSLARATVKGIIEILKWASGKILDLAVALVDALFTVAETTLRYADELLNTPIEFRPIVDLVEWVYKQAHSNEPAPPPPPKLTLGGLSALIVAFPATVAWKLAVGDPNSGPFPGGKLPRPGQLSNPSPGQACLLVGGTIQMTYTILDITNDIKSTNLTAAMAIYSELCMPMLIWPTAAGIPFTFSSTETPLQQFFRIANWIPGCCYPVLDILFLGLSYRSLARNVEPVGQTCLWLLGTFNWVMGFAESIVTAETSTPAGITANILSPLSPAAQLLRLLGKNDPEALAVKLVTNLLSDGGGGAARIAAACGR